jgi:uncharacterized protein YdeI (YjbR/CyaY-like superfamily)
MRNVERLTKEKRMQPAGIRAWQARKENKSGIYAYEQRSPELVEPYAGKFKQHKQAWKFYQAQPPGYRKIMNWYILSARLEKTRLARLERLIEASAEGIRLR